MKNKINVSAFFFLILAPTLLLSNSSEAEGYAYFFQDAQSTAFTQAGSCVGYDNGSSSFYNPAAMSLHTKPIVSTGAEVLISSIKFNDEGSSVLGSPARGEDGKNGGNTAFVPHTYYVQPINEKLNLGFVVNAPFGLATKYDRNWIGRYEATDSELSTVNIGPAISYKITDALSLGGSVSAVYAKAKLSNAIDFGTIGTGALGPETASSLGLFPQQNDGFVKTKGEDWGMGWSSGLIYQYGKDKRNRAGFIYRGKTDLHLHGDKAEFDVPASASVLTAGGAFQDSNTRADVVLPEVLAAGLKQSVSDSTALLYQSQYIHWSRFKELRIRFDNPAQPDSVTEESYDNAWTHSLGIENNSLENWTLRSGISYAMSPIRNVALRSPRLPENNYIAAGLGVGRNLTEKIRLDLGYAHVFVLDSPADYKGPTADTIKGDWNLHSNTIAATVSWTF